MEGYYDINVEDSKNLLHNLLQITTQFQAKIGLLRRASQHDMQFTTNLEYCANDFESCRTPPPVTVSFLNFPNLSPAPPSEWFANYIYKIEDNTESRFIRA